MRATTMKWSEEEWEAIVNKAKELLTVNPKLNKQQLLASAQQILPPARQRANIYSGQLGIFVKRLRGEAVEHKARGPYKKKIKATRKYTKRAAVLPIAGAPPVLAVAVPAPVVRFCPNCAFDLTRIKLT